ncbi:MAG: cation:proton antiporter [Deltaproteobacteria bacterium]|nr:MAG: cation:proton antiporter [Deltaproteobacteria bacterium]
MEPTAVNVVDNNFLLVAVMIPLVGSLVVMTMKKNPNLREFISSSASFLLLAVVLSFIPALRDGKILQYTVFQLLPGLTITLRADGFSMIFALVASTLWAISVFYSMGYMRAHDEPGQTRFNACFALAIFGAMGVAFSDNLLTMCLFYEIVSVCTYPLVAHHQDETSYEGARKYIIYLTTTAKFFLLPAIILIYVLAGTLDFPDNILTGMLPADTRGWLVVMLWVFCLFGFAKNGVMPFHHWLPGTMVAPTPVLALLHAVAVVKVGVFCTTRTMLYVFGLETMHQLNLGIPTAYFVGFTIIMASLIALGKDNLKARLAYSTLSQLSYIILGVAMLTPHAIEGGLIHIVNHAFSKITLFFCAGAVSIVAHKKCISEMGGLGRTMPFTFAAFAVASLSMIGAPPVAGFISRWYLLVGSMEAGQLGLLLILILSTVLNAGYFVPITLQAFFGRRPDGQEETGIREAPLAMLIPILITATISVIIGIFPHFMMQFVRMVTG